MGVDYREQYEPDQLEPFWPNEILRMVVVVLCTLAVISLMAVLPVLLEHVDLGHLIHEEEPANRRETPGDILPEWYFLAVYQYLKLPPQDFLGISGKTIGVLSQGPFALAVILLPFWARRWSHRLGVLHGLIITAVIAIFVGLTFGAHWPDHWPPSPLFLTIFAVAVFLFYLLIFQERRTIRRVMQRKEHTR